MTLKRIFFFIAVLPLLIYTQPGEIYFQQEVNYKIDVKLDDVNHYLFASEKIEYINNSPDTLKFLYFHLWPNAYKNNNTALAKQFVANGKLEMYFAKEKDLGWIDSLDFKANNEKIKWELDAVNIDIAKLYLNTPLKPGGKIEITTPFRVKIPSATLSRLGHIDQAYAISQWYPKPAVYDMNGWNQMPYLDQGEFYSEWGSFDVSITLPENYVLGATGDLEGGEDEMKWLDQKIKQTENKISYRRKLENIPGAVIVDSLGFPRSSDEFKTLRYKQKNVHDFAWFADKRFNVLKANVTLPKNRRSVTCWAMFTDNNFNLWLRAPEYIADATFFYSLWNGDYQYNNVTAIDGTISAGGGMEYPNITIIGEASSAFELETVIMHEVGHNWFYGMLGSNERLHGWMDEGINSFNELRYNRTKYPGSTTGALLGLDSTDHWFGLHKFKNSYQYYFLYEKQALENRDQPLEQHSALFTDANYGAMVYCKTAIMFDYLFHYMGEQRFDEAMKFYFEHFHFKHPYPSDLRKTLEYFSGKNLSWFFDDMLGTTKKLDYRVEKYRNEENGAHSVLVKNTGEIKGPVLLCGMKNGKLKGMVWYDGFEGEKWLGFPIGEVDEFIIDQPMIMPEEHRQNNRIRTHGLFPRVEPLQVRMVGMHDDPSRTQLFATPVAGYNLYNGFMAGLHFHNSMLFEKKFDFEIMPLYGFKDKQLAGLGRFQFNFHPHKNFQTINAGLNLKRFAFNSKPDINYARIENYFTFELKNKNPRSHIINKFSLHYINLFIDKVNYDTTGSYQKFNQQKTFSEFRFSHENQRTLNPYSFKFTFQAGDSANILKMKDPLLKLWGEFNFHWTMDKKNNGFDFRIFGGTILSGGQAYTYAFRMGGITGFQDYTYQYSYFGRSEYSGLASQLYVDGDGGFKVRTYLGQSSKYLLALNIKTPRLFNMLGLFADIGTCGSDGLMPKIPGSTDVPNTVLYDFGVNLEFGKGLANIYIPLSYSKDITNNIKINGWNFGQRIRINLRLDQMNPKKLTNKLISL